MKWVKEFMYLRNETVEYIFLEGRMVGIYNLHTQWFYCLHQLHKHARSSRAKYAEMIGLFL